MEKQKINKSYYDKNKERLKEYARNYRLTHPGGSTRQWKKWKEKNPVAALKHKMDCAIRSKKYSFEKRYGITLEQKELMRVSQNNLCSICRSEFQSAEDTHLDHNHSTGQIRELLCGRCNRALGLLKEDINTINSLVVYINKWQKQKEK